MFLASDNYSGGGWAPVSSNNGWGAHAVPYNSGNIGFGYGSIFNKILYGIILLLAITSVGQVRFIIYFLDVRSPIRHKQSLFI